MNRYAVPGVPSQHYINTVEEGYADNGLDLAYLDESLYDNCRECRFRLEQIQKKDVLLDILIL